MTATAGNQLHGITLAAIMAELRAAYSWPELFALVPIRCFELKPSIKSSLTFLRRTPWARAKVEELYVALRRDRPAP